MKVGDFVKLKDCYDAFLYNNLPVTGIVVWSHPRNDFPHEYIKLHNLQVEVLTKYYEVVSESR